MAQRGVLEVAQTGSRPVYDSHVTGGTNDDRSGPGWLFHKIFGITPDPPGETSEQRLDRARAWLASDSPKCRRQGLHILAAAAPDEAVEALLRGLTDPDKDVRMAAGIGLMMRDKPHESSDRIVEALGGDEATATWFVRLGGGPGIIGTLGLTDRLLPHLSDIARNAQPRRERRTAAKYVRALQSRPVGWPVAG